MKLSKTLANENDLIEVLIDGYPGGHDGFVFETDSNLKIWTSSNKGQQIVFPGGGIQSELLELDANGNLTVFVEWVSAHHGTSDLRLVDEASGFVMDTLTFHTFRSVVIALGGLDPVPSVPTDPNHGLFLIADQIYQEGYDVHKYDEDNVSSGFIPGPMYPAGSGVPFDEVAGAVNNRFVSDVSIIGYSQGGGSTYNLSAYLSERRVAGEVNPFDLVFTTYLDAVADDGPFAEGRLPLNTQWHLNLYQQIDDVLDGTPTPGGNENIDVEVSPLFPFDEISHTDIDHQPSVMEWVLMRFRQRVIQ